MRRLIVFSIAALSLTGLSATPASAEFGLSEFDVSFLDSEGNPQLRAGSHPYAMRTSFRVNSTEEPKKGVQVVDGAIRDLDIVMPAGFVGNPSAVPRCETLEFLAEDPEGHPNCADSTALGILTVELSGGLGTSGEETVAVYNLRPSPGRAAKLGFWVGGAAITVDVVASQSSPYNVIGRLHNTSQVAEVLHSELTLWGNPAAAAHDEDRGRCAYEKVAGKCPAGIPVKTFLTLPRSCASPLRFLFKALSWWSGNPEDPGPPVQTEDLLETHAPTECSKLLFGPELDAQPTTDHAESPSGLDVNLQVEDEGLSDPDGTARSDINRATLTLPEGMTANPSVAEGLATCSPEDLGRETLNSPFGAGCPPASKIGTVLSRTPILEGTLLEGSLFIATPDDPSTAKPGAENPFDSLLALYVVIHEPNLGVLVKQAGKLEPDLRTGQLKTTFDDLPPVPLSEIRVHLREGGRSPLITPPLCGNFASLAQLTPSGNPENVLPLSPVFQITNGVGGGPCPSGPTPPFEPGFEAATLNNDAGSFSPFHMRLTRRDGDQDLTRFDAILPPGALAKLAGVAQCPDSQVALAKAKRGRAELASPSCPADSLIGHVAGGAGVGSQLTYASGRLYLAGAFAGAPLSVVGIVPAVAGPFDVGTIVVRQALDVNPKTGQAIVDGSRSDPIPHILAGIPLRVRDIRVDVDRPEFTLNPTDCSPFATLAQIWGGGANVFSPLDDSPAQRQARFQAANCASLAFKPRLTMSLKGGTGRGAHPAFKAVFKPRKGDANLAGLSVRLPRSAFLDQGHIRTICTRVQFAADACPRAAIYGQVSALTPLLEEPLSGPVYLRSSNHNLPDLVFDLHGLVDVEVSVRIDSVKGGIRARIEDAPDAPVTKAVVQMQGAKKGLIINSRNLCSGTFPARVQARGQNGRVRAMRPVVRALGCGGKSGK
jgi:hypothetical protein